MRGQALRRRWVTAALLIGFALGAWGLGTTVLLNSADRAAAAGKYRRAALMYRMATCVLLRSQRLHAYLGLADSIWHLPDADSDPVSYLLRARRLAQPGMQKADVDVRIAGILRRQSVVPGEAEKYAREGVKEAPNWAVAHQVLGRVLMDWPLEHKRKAEAEKEFREAIRLAPDDPFPQFCLGFLLSLEKRYPEAEAALRESFRKGLPEAEDAFDSLAEVLLAQGKYSEAKEVAEEYLRHHPHLSYAKSLLREATEGEQRER